MTTSYRKSATCHKGSFQARPQCQIDCYPKGRWIWRSISSGCVIPVRGSSYAHSSPCKLYMQVLPPAGLLLRRVGWAIANSTQYRTLALTLLAIFFLWSQLPVVKRLYVPIWSIPCRVYLIYIYIYIIYNAIANKPNPTEDFKLVAFDQGESVKLSTCLAQTTNTPIWHKLYRQRNCVLRTAVLVFLKKKVDTALPSSGHCQIRGDKIKARRRDGASWSLQELS